MAQPTFTVLPISSTRTDLEKIRRADYELVVDRAAAYRALLFNAGQKGFLWMPLQSDLYKDSGKTTPVDYAGEVCAAVDDLSGNNCHGTETSSGAGPTYGGRYFNRPASRLGALNVDLPTRTTTMSLFFVVRGPVTSALQALLSVRSTSANGNLFLTEYNSSSASSSVAGTPTFYKNGVLIDNPTRGNLYNAIAGDEAKVIEVRAANLSGSAFANLHIGCNKSNTYPVRYDIGDFILVESPTTTIAAQVTALMMRYHGISA